MKKFILTAIVCAIASVATMAQNGNGRQRFDPTELHNRQADRLAKQMKLDDEKAAAFKVLYLDYQTARQNAANPKGENANQERPDYSKLTDAQATELIQKHFTTQEATLAVDKDYLPKFLELLTPAQAAQVYLLRGQRGGQNMQRGQGRPNFGGGFGGPGGGFGGPGGDF